MRLAVLLVACFAAAVSSHDSNDLKPLKHISCKGNKPITLMVREQRVVVGDQLAFTTRAYYYKHKPYLPGPAIDMYPGTTCEIEIINELSDSGNEACLADRANGRMNEMHCPDVTNLHTHGLHVGPTEDNIAIDLFPGQSHTYTYNVPEDHMMGMHWYHAHHHGSVSLHTMGGLAGALFVKPNQDYFDELPSDIRKLYSKGNKHLYEIVMNHIFFGEGDPVMGDMAQLSYPEVAARYAGNSIDPNPEFFTGVKNFYAVNGQYQPNIKVASGSTALFRMLHAVGTRAVVLKLDRPELCEIRLLARDGVFHQDEYIPVNKLVFIQATRADYAVKCTLPDGEDAPLVINVAAVDDDIGPLWGNVHKQDTVFTITIGKKLATKRRLRMPTSIISLPSYMSNLLDKSVEATQVVDMDDFAINTIKFPGFDAPVESRYLYSQCLNKVYQVSLSPYTPPARLLRTVSDAPNSSVRLEARKALASRVLHGTDPEVGAGVDGFDPDAGLHAYHQHINHFQVEHFFGLEVEPDFFRVGEWRDTVSQIVTGTMVRTRPVDYTGDIYFHCHVTQHEDMGMMALYNVHTC